LPPLTILPLGTPWPPSANLQPGAATGAPQGQIVPGLVPGKPKHEGPEPTLNPAPRASTAPAVAPQAPPKRDEQQKPKDKSEPKKSGKPASKSDDATSKPQPSGRALPRTGPADPVVLLGQVPTQPCRTGGFTRSRSAASADASVTRATVSAPQSFRGSAGPAANFADNGRRTTSGAKPMAADPVARPARRSLLDRLLRKDP
jgi:hypothetical protein